MVEVLSRAQFAFTVGFHIIWPTLSIGLCFFLVLIEALWLYTKDLNYLKLYKFWVRIFALSFAIGVVTGTPLSYQFGTNFSEFSKIAGNIMGPLLGVEVMTAFFLEAVFIGIMLFGWNRVGPKLHFMATFCVCLGTHNSSFWIIAANSWMHTPAGYSFQDGVIVVDSWKEVIFNPSFFYRFYYT